MTDDGNQKYVWDSLNRLIQVKDSGNNLIVDYYYNAENLRVEKHHAGGSKEQFYYDGARVVEETDGSQNLVREYANGSQYVDEVILVANTVGASVTYYYYMSDLRYSVYGFVDSSGAVVESAKYDGYGKRTLLDATIATPVVDQSYGYTSIRHDSETGLQYYRARCFDNNLGRFINRDPVGYIDGLNLYGGYFVVNGLDPFGLCKTIKPSREDGWAQKENRDWTISSDKFKKYLTEDEANMKGENRGKSTYDKGYLGVTECLMGTHFKNFKECYLASEAKALEKAKEKKDCKDGLVVCEYGLRYNDSQPPAKSMTPGKDEFTVDPNELVKNNRYEFDFGFRQSDGSYIHVNQTANNPDGMTVIYSPAFNEFENNYSGFNTTVYCIQCCKCSGR